MDEIVIFLLFLGLVTFTTGTIGILRFPDFYTRLHAAGKCDTMGAILALSAVALYNLRDPSWPSLLVSLKVMLILVFVFVASPTSTHAITQAAMIIGIEPWSKEKR